MRRIRRPRSNLRQPVTVCEEFASWAASLSFDQLPASVVERSRLQRRSIEAAARAGTDAAAPFAAAAPDGQLGAVYMSAVASMAHDWDDYLYMGHTGHSAVPASAFAADDRRALVAQVAANEVAGRLGAALLIGPHNGQFWSAIHCASAALAGGVALRLDSDRLAHALAIALYQPPFGLWPGFMGPASKLVTAADPALQGARAALVAADGVDGPLDVVEHPRGLLRYFADVGRPRMLGALGSVWLTDTLAFKPRPGCAYLQAAVDAALRVDAAADEIASVEVEAGLMTLAMDRLSAHAPLTPVKVNFSTPLSVALALAEGDLTHRQLEPDRLARAADLAPKVRVRHDWELTLRTAEGMAAGGASPREVALASLPKLLRRAEELPISNLGQLVRERSLRRRLGALVRGDGAGIEALDTPRLRMTFPCRLRVRLHSGRAIDVDGEERGGCGAPVRDQAAVVAAKAELAAAPAPV
jgi:2-methylcitrate dehydratase PrpD